MKKYLIPLLLLIVFSINGCGKKTDHYISPKNNDISIDDGNNLNTQEQQIYEPMELEIKDDKPKVLKETDYYEPVTGDNLTVAAEFVKDIIDENFDKLQNAYQYDNDMKLEIRNKETQKTVVFKNTEFGKVKKILEPYTLYHEALQYVMIPVKCEQENYNFQITFDVNHNILGFTYTEYIEKDSKKDRSIPKNVEETMYSFLSDGFTIPGTLTKPKQQTSFPLVILVHGQGQLDRDASIYENKPFRDIAWGLAELGIASFRYDKRSYLYNKEIMENKNTTIYDETINDVIAAYNMLKSQEDYTFSGTFILGHSQGGYVIPRISKQLTDAAGYIIMASPAEHIKEYYMEQYEFLTAEDGIITSAEDALIRKVNKDLAYLDDPKWIPDDRPVFGAYKNYWLDLNQYDAIIEAQYIAQPVLVLQGVRDYQVTMKQFDVWRNAFYNFENWDFKSYPTLNHLMMKGEGNPNTAEYQKKAYVDNQVITDIADFILLKYTE